MIADSKAREYEKFFKLQAYDFDRPMGDPILSEGTMVNGVLRPNNNHLSLIQENETAYLIDPSDFVLVPQFDVKGACGLGFTNPEELIKGGWYLKKLGCEIKGYHLNLAALLLWVVMVKV